MLWGKECILAKNLPLRFLYNILTQLAWLALQAVALFKPKIDRFVKGRRQSFSQLSGLSPRKGTLWMHVASLGEYEQGLPILEGLRRAYPRHQILLTFFSPSGYEVKKDSPLAEVVAYLPMDSMANCRKFLEMAKPQLAIFIKYEIWPNYLEALKKRGIPTLLASARFTKRQVFFKPYGGFMRKSLRAFDHFFVQDENSMALLRGLGLENITLGGDSRFDRVLEIAGTDNRLDFMESFKQGNFTLVAGSSWPRDEDLLVPYINAANRDMKFVIAPHEIKREHLDKIREALQKKTLLFSELQERRPGDFQVLILDTIGLLNKVYSYADVAYVGGGFATGLHNTLEPAVHGIPVIIGPHFQEFREAVDLVGLGGLFPVTDARGFQRTLDGLKGDSPLLERSGQINRDYIRARAGATQRILGHIAEII